MIVNDSNEIFLNENIPNHIAIIMDGNGRWAKRRHLPRVAGHKRGMDVAKIVTQEASNLGVRVLTLYAFSTENWKRPSSEVSFLMKLPIDFFGTFVPDLIEQNIRVQVMGDVTKLPKDTQKSVRDAVAQTSRNTGMILNFALNYGGRDEIIQAVQSIAEQVSGKQLIPEQIDAKLFAKNLMTNQLGELADPDLLIRTSGEERISNFLLWQIAYSEMVFTDTLWPDFDEQELKNCIQQFQKRDRRFGGIKK
ncbi:isoprenyl transferase [Pediococcus claussenii]|uniref:isoprenyl transferase n=1 Tax=Pediococcus claussenii TaxID=187452 RepID=UPI0039DFC94A